MWTSDGTEEGTHIVEDVAPGSETSRPGLLTNVEGTLYFAADDGVTGYELWKANAEGTDAERVTDLHPSGDSLIRATGEALLVPFDGSLYFGADDGTHGYELWRLPLTSGGDDMPPSIRVDTPDEGATYTLGESVLADYSCTDFGGSELASCLGNVPDGDPIDTGALGAKTFTVRASDGAGNESTRSVSYVVVPQPDVTPPTITIISPVDGVAYNLDEPVLASYSCADEGGSELASCTGTVADGSAVDTSSPGRRPSPSRRATARETAHLRA